jgi:hypothetical protein
MSGDAEAGAEPTGAAGEAPERVALSRLLDSLERAFAAPAPPEQAERGPTAPSPSDPRARRPARRERPNNHHARALLLALGEGLHELGAEALGPELVARTAALIGRDEEAWQAAVAREVELAAWEYDQSVDPRYLAQPDYDLDYTLAARDRLELRLLALEPLGFEPPAELLEKIDRADERLERGLGRPPRRDRGQDGSDRNR